MTIKIKWAGAWETVNPGKMKVKWGSVWYPAGNVRAKWGTSWYATGYIGLPAIPPEPTIADYNYGQHSGGPENTIKVSIRKPTAVAVPSAQYDVLLMNGSGGHLVQRRVDNSVATTEFGSLDWGARYQIATRSVGATGLVSPWSAHQRIDFGKPNTIGQKKVFKTRDWVRSVNLDMYRGQKEGVVVPNDVVATYMIFDIRGTFPANVLSDPGSWREVHLIIQGNEGDTLSWPNPYRATRDIKNSPGEGKLFGLVPRGDGWTVFNEGTASHLVGTLTVKGNETYADWVDYTIPGEKFGYW